MNMVSPTESVSRNGSCSETAPGGFQSRIPVALVDASPLRRAAITRLLEHGPEGGEAAYEVVRGTESPEEVPQEVDLRLILISLGSAPAPISDIPGMLGGLRRRRGDVPTVILSELSDTAAVVAACKAGAAGFITGDVAPRLMFNALKFILEGGVFFPLEALLGRLQDQAEHVRTKSTGAAAPLPPDSVANTAALTSRQRDVLDLLCQGQSNKRIAIALQMCESTVKVHVRQIMRKLGASNRTQAALCARELAAVPSLSPEEP